MKLIPGPLQNLLRGRTAESFVGLIHRRQQFDIGTRVAIRKAMPPVSSRLHFAALLVAPNQSRHLRAAQPGHLGEVAPHQSFALASEAAVIVLHQGLVDPPVYLPSVLGLKTHLFAGLQQRPDLLQAQFLSVFHADNQSPACAIFPSGSSCVRNKAKLQAHLLRNTFLRKSCFSGNQLESQSLGLRFQLGFGAETRRLF